LKKRETFSQWPKKKDSSLRQKVYRRWRSGVYKIRQVEDPRDSKKATEKIVEKSTGKIVLKQSEVEDVVKAYYKQTKGEGARKLQKI